MSNERKVLFTKQKEDYEQNIKQLNQHILDTDDQIKAKDAHIDNLNQNLQEGKNQVGQLENYVENLKKEKETAVREAELMFNNQFIKCNEKYQNELLKLNSEIKVFKDEKAKDQELISINIKNIEELNNQQNERIN